MAKLRAVKGILKTFFWLVKEEYDAMDNKLVRIVGGAIAFILITLFWYFFFRNFKPF